MAAACENRGLRPFIHVNRVQVAPPCTVSADEIRQGLSILDETLQVADSYYSG